jgi:hypothetical protein
LVSIWGGTAIRKGKRPFRDAIVVFDEAENIEVVFHFQEAARRLCKVDELAAR